MTIQRVQTGTYPNDGSGDTLRASFTKVNENFVELYKNDSDSANTVNLVFNTVNTGVNTAVSIANAAYLRASQALLDANNLGDNIGVAFYQANIAFDKANGVTQNAKSSFDRSNLIYNYSNNITQVLANTINTTNIIYTFANNVFDSRNVTDNRANAIYLFSNTVHAKVNSNFVTTNAAYRTSNAAFSHSNTVYNFANTVEVKADSKLANTSGVSFDGDLYMPSGSLGIGTSSVPLDFKIDVVGRARFGTYHVVEPDGAAAFRTGVQGWAIRVHGGGYALADQAATIQFTDSGITKQLGSIIVDESTNKMNIGTDVPLDVSFRTSGIQAGYFDRNNQNLVVNNRVITQGLVSITDNNYFCDPNGDSRLKYIYAGNDAWHRSYPDTSRRLYFESNGPTSVVGGQFFQFYLKFGTSDGTTRSVFTGGGNFYTNGNVVAYWSDKRLKKNIEKISDWREILGKINGYRFNWNDLGKKILANDEDGDKVEVGLIAQEVKEALPQAAAIQMMQYTDFKDGEYVPKEDIDYDKNDPYLTVRQEKIIPVLVEAIKGLMKEVDELKEQLSERKK